MDIEKEFLKISKTLKAKYTSKEHTVGGVELGSRIFISEHYFNIPHNNFSIKAYYNLGSSNIAELNCSFNVNKNIPNFEISTREHFIRLVSFNDKIWKIKCKDKFFTSKIRNLLDHYKLTDIAKQEAFEPLINGKRNNDSYVLNLKYYLGFNNKEKSILTIINFYKGFINLIKSID